MVIIRDSCCIEVCSELNTWIDCIFVVDGNDKGRAVAALEKAFDDFCEEENECYGDFFKRRMDEAGIGYELFYGEGDDGEDE